MTKRINAGMQGMPLFDLASLAEVKTFILDAQ